MRAWYPLGMLIGGAAGALSFSVLGEEALEAVIIGSILAAILLGWVAMFENHAVRYAGLFSWGGMLQPVWRRMFSPARPSWSIVGVMFFAGVVAGVCVRMLLFVEA